MCKLAFTTIWKTHCTAIHSLHRKCPQLEIRRGRRASGRVELWANQQILRLYELKQQILRLLLRIAVLVGPAHPADGVLKSVICNPNAVFGTRLRNTRLLAQQAKFTWKNCTTNNKNHRFLSPKSSLKAFKKGFLKWSLQNVIILSIFSIVLRNFKKADLWFWRHGQCFVSFFV